MKQTISLKQQKTITVENENFASVDLGFSIPFTYDEIEGAPDYKAQFDANTLDMIYVTATLKGQTEQPIRIYDNISLADIHKEHFKAVEGWNELYMLVQSGEASKPNTYEGSLPIPFSVINLNGAESLDLDIRISDVELSTEGEFEIDKTAVAVEVSTKEAVALQNAITTLERVAIDDEYKKKYPLEGAITSVAWCQNSKKNFDFIEASVNSDLLNTEIDSITVMSNGVKKDNVFTVEYVPLLSITAPIKNLILEIKRLKIADSEAYLLVRRTVVGRKSYANFMAKTGAHTRTNAQRLVTN